MSFDIIANNSTPNKFKLYDLSTHFKNKSATPAITTEQTNQNYNLNLSAQEMQAALDTAANMELEETSFEFQWPWAKRTSKDGVIEDSKQRATGDCWLLSAVNSLSYTEEGKKAIKEALDYQDNGDVIVHLKGIGDYTVTKEEFEKIRKEQENGSREYSLGDDDMLIMELAIEKVMEDLAKANFQFKSVSGFENPWQIQSDIENNGSAIWAGHMSQALYLITGKPATETIKKDEIKNLIENFDNKSLSLGASVAHDKTVVDFEGNEINLPGPHAYAIKSCDENSVTIVNPWDSSKEIKLDKETFLNAITTVTYCDLKEESVNYIKYPDAIDENGNKLYIDEVNQDPCFIYNNTIGKRIYPTYSYRIFDPNGITSQSGYMDENKDKMCSTTWEKGNDGNLYQSEKMEYYQEESKGISVIYNEDGSVKSYQMYEFEPNGDWKILQGIGSKYHYQDIMERDLMNYSQFNVIEIWKLGTLSDEKWEEVAQYLQQNPNATYDEIKENIN